MILLMFPENLKGSVCCAGVCLLIALTACAPSPGGAAPVSGPVPPAGPELPFQPALLTVEAVLPDGAPVPELARLIAEFHAEISVSPEPAFRSETAVPQGPGPLAVSLPLPPAFSLDEGPFGVSLRLKSGTALLYAAPAPVRVASRDDLSGIMVRLADPATLLRSAVMAPEGALYICGGKQVILAIGTGAAYITYPTGESARLRKAETHGAGGEIFTNGSLRLERLPGAPAATARLALAEGSGEPQPCHLAR